MNDETNFEIDQDVLAEYLDEALEMLNQAEEAFLKIEQDQNDFKSIDNSFRVMHTIKGNSGFFNLLSVKKLAHVMEDLMNLFRGKKLKIESEHITALLEATEYLHSIFERIRHGLPEVDDSIFYDQIYFKIKDLSSVKIEEDPTKKFFTVFEQFANVFYSEDEEVQNVYNDLIDQYNAIAQVAITPNLFKDDSLQGKIINLIDGNLDKSSQDDCLSKEITQQVYELLKELKNQAQPESATRIKEIFELYDLLVPRVGFTSILSAELIPRISAVQVIDKNETRQQPSNATSASNTPVIEKQATQTQAVVHQEIKAETPPATEQDTSQRTMRINEESIDQLIDTIGELLIIGEIYNNITNKLVSENKLGEEQITADLQKNNESFSNISESLQRSILDIRKLPIGKVLQKANKIIRDICTKQNKKIRINITGDQILLDKSLVEPLDGALVHIFRNAADHGVEEVEKRIANNKNPEGLVDISCTDNEEFIFITIRDDGAGINLEKLKNKAVQKGLIEQNIANNLTKQEILDLIFLPGLSMSEQISDISGRGVGMDVVKQNIAAIGGKISLDSEEGKGTSIKISVQKSYLVKIVNGFVVRVADNKFILSLEYIGESVEFKNSAVNQSPDGNEYILFHNQNYSLVRFNKIFENFAVEQKDDEIGVIISKNNKKFILVIDEIIGILKVVVKDVESLNYMSDKITGFALLGDDSIASVLDLEKACFSRIS